MATAFRAALEEWKDGFNVGAQDFKDKIWAPKYAVYEKALKDLDKLDPTFTGDLGRELYKEGLSATGTARRQNSNQEVDHGVLELAARHAAELRRQRQEEQRASDDRAAAAATQETF